jgi:hypothetical protein
MRRFLPRLEFYFTPRCWLLGLYWPKWGPFTVLLGPVRVEVH